MRKQVQNHSPRPFVSMFIGRHILLKVQVVLGAADDAAMREIEQIMRGSKAQVGEVEGFSMRAMSLVA